MQTSFKHRFFAETSIWYQDGQINRDQRDLLLERYHTSTSALPGILRWLGIFALICVGLSLIAFLAALSQSLVGGAILLTILSAASMYHGVKLSTSTPCNHRLTGSALITSGLLTGYALLCVIHLIAGGSGSDAVVYVLNLYIISALGMVLAYRSRTTAPLTFALICGFHAVGGPHGHTSYIGDIFEFQNLYRIAGIAALVVAFGVYHERILERRSAKHHLDFGDCYIRLGLLYLNSALFAVMLEPLFHSSRWGGEMTTLGLVLAAEIAIGILLRDARFISYSSLFLHLHIFCRILTYFDSTATIARATLAVGVVSVALGFYFERLNSSSTAASLSRPAGSKPLRRELSELVRLLILSPEQVGQLRARYQLFNWEFGGLARWYIFGGALLTVVSFAALVSQIIALTLSDAVFALAVSFLALISASYMLKERGRATAAAATEFLAALSLIGCSFALGKLLSDGRSSPTFLIFCDLGAMMFMAYHFRNSKILYLGIALVYGFVISLSEDFAAGRSHVLGLGLPLRFLLTSALITGIGFMQLRHSLASGRSLRRAPEGFAVCWLWSGLLVAELSFAILAVGGNEGYVYSESSSVSLFLFNLLWAAMNAGLLLSAQQLNLPMLGNIGLLFAIVQPYVLLFRYVAPSLGATLTFFIAGTSALLLVFNLETVTGLGKESGTRDNSQKEP